MRPVPPERAVGLSLYLEGRYSGEEAALEEKVIFGQRHGDWKWALNLGHETEWEDNLREREGKFMGSFGLARDLGRNWSLGLEALTESPAPDYRQFGSAAVLLGPDVWLGLE